MKLRKLLVALFVFLISHAFGQRALAGYYKEWNLADLQAKYRKAIADPVPWAGWWWPYSENGIADGFGDPNKLSPAEKLDEVFGNNNWIAGWEYQFHGFGRGSLDWWGHCNGWATAAIMEREPRKAKRINGVKLEVRDLKAILSEYWMESGSDFIGMRNWDNDTSSASFWDVTPAQFHLAMTNIVGRQRRSVIVDRYTGAEVWNHPVVAYEIEPIRERDYLGPDPRYDNLYRINVTAHLWWAADDVDPNDVTAKFEWKENDFFEQRTLRYELWLDAPPRFDSSGRLISSGDIISTNTGVGGRWKNGTSYEVLIESHPDFIWIPLSYARSTGEKNPRLNDAWVHENLSDPNFFD